MKANSISKKDGAKIACQNKKTQRKEEIIEGYGWVGKKDR